MIYHSVWPEKEVVTIKQSTLKNLSQLQIDYINRLYYRIPIIDNEIGARFITSEMRLLWYKEMLAVFNEFNKIEPLKAEFEDFDDNVKNMMNLVDFIRNVLLHFPYFSTWNDVFITKDIAKSQILPSKGGQIMKFLNTAADKKSFFLRMKYFDDDKRREARILFPIVESDDQEVWLKDIINETNGIICVLAVMNSITNKIMVPIKLSQLNKSLNVTSEKIESFKKNTCYVNQTPIHRLGYIKTPQWYSNFRF